MNESVNPIVKYFSEFKILKTVSKDFWLTNVVQFFDGMAYFSMITVFVLYLTDYCSFASSWGWARISAPRWIADGWPS